MSTAQTTTAMEDVESGDGNGKYGNEITDDSNNNNPRVLDRDDSELDKHDDPFAPREGKTLTWTNIHMTLVRANDDVKVLLYIVLP
jgi:hypothetical protein